ncbi:hypothetical protein TI05_15510, partial [Achromatium sp. WMS3]
PLTDTKLAETLETILKASPTAIGIDIYRNFSVPPGTKRFHKLLVDNPNIIVVEKHPTATTPGVPPPEVLAGTNNRKRVGFADIALDSGGIVRRNLMFNQNGDMVGFSFALRLALKYLASKNIYPQENKPNPALLRLGHVVFYPLTGDEGGYANMDMGGYQIILDYIGGIKPFPHFSFGDLWDGHIDTALLKDQIIILGGHSESVKDQFHAPHAILGYDQGEITGSTYHAHAVRQFLEAAFNGRNPIAVWNVWTEYLWIFLWTGCGLLIGWFAISSWILILFTAISSILLITACIFAFTIGFWIPLVPTLLGWNAAMALGTVLRSSEQRHEQQLLMGLFEKHSSPKVARTIWKHRDEVLEDGRICPKVLMATMVFSDLQGFTKISESMPPKQFLDWLNRYLGAMTDVIMKHDGVLDDYAGDGIKANFGVPIENVAPEQVSLNARKAVDCAFELGQELNRLNRESKAVDFPIVGMRIGVHTGSVVVGTVGSKQRMKYTTVGSNVNLAARLESLREVPGPDPHDETNSFRILVSAATAKLLGDNYHVTSQGSFHLKGIQG